MAATSFSPLYIPLSVRVQTVPSESEKTEMTFSPLGSLRHSDSVQSFPSLE